MGYIPPPPPRRKMNRLICGYCETQNDKNNQACVACGGALYDEISQKRNGNKLEDDEIYCPDPTHPGGFIRTGVIHPGSSAKQFGITVNEAYEAIINVFGY